MNERRLAVVDLGSNSFRLVEFTWVPGQWWKRTDEIHEPVRIGAGLDAAGVLGPEPMERALETVELYAHFCRATGIEDVRAVATRWSGGGHKNAAGCTVTGEYEDLKKAFVDAIGVELKSLV